MDIWVYIQITPEKNCSMHLTIFSSLGSLQYEHWHFFLLYFMSGFSHKKLISNIFLRSFRKQTLTWIFKFIELSRGRIGFVITYIHETLFHSIHFSISRLFILLVSSLVTFTGFIQFTCKSFFVSPKHYAQSGKAIKLGLVYTT